MQHRDGPHVGARDRVLEQALDELGAIQDAQPPEQILHLLQSAAERTRVQRSDLVIRIRNGGRWDALERIEDP